MFEFIKKYSFLIKVYAIILIILNLVLIGMYFRFKKTLTEQKMMVRSIPKQKVKSEPTKQNITITIEEI